jgi:hypothetical protein
MSVALEKNIRFWHWFPELLVKDLTPEQLHWQPENHDSSIMFTLWHVYRSSDELLHGLLIKQPSLFQAQGWAERLPVERTGATPFGNGLDREGISKINLDIGAMLEYAKAVGDKAVAYLGSLTPEERAEEMDLPFFRGTYEYVDRVSREEAVAFFLVGHTAEHLGEVQFLRGLMGLKGAPM